MLLPSTTLRPSTPEGYVEQIVSGPSRARMAEFENRRLILEGDWRPLVWGLMRRYEYSDDIYRKVAQRVKRSSNVANKVLRKVALAYKVPPQRTIAKASEATQKAFRKVVLEQGGLTVHPQRWERLVWGMNVVITVPTVYPAPAEPFQRRLAYEALTGANTEVVTREDSPTAEPVASVTEIVTRGGYDFGPSTFVVIDDKAYTTIDSDGKFIGRVPHNAGIWPGTVWRRQHGSDWWCTDVGAGLFEATLEVAHIMARLDWIRQGQDHPREFLFTSEMQDVPRQVAGSDGPVEVPVSPNEARYQLENVAVSPDNHVKHAIQHARDGAESLGVDADLLDFQEGAEGIEPLVAAQKHGDLMALRQSTIPHFRRAEKQSSWKTSLVLRGAGHPVSRQLRPSAIMDGFEAHWSELEFVDHPETQLRVLEAEVDMGLKSTIDAYMAKHPGMSREEAKAEVRRIDEEEAERADFLAKRNSPRLLKDRRSNIAELQGRIGGMESGITRSEDNAGNSERSDRPRRARERGTGT